MRSTAATVALFGPAQHGQRVRQNSFLKFNMEDTNSLNRTRTVNKEAKDFLFYKMFFIKFYFFAMLNSNLTIAHHPIPIKMGGSDPKKMNIFQETPSLLIINGRRVTSVSDYSDDKRGASSFRRLLRLPCLCFFFIIISTPSFPFREAFASIFSCCRVND